MSSMQWNLVGDAGADGYYEKTWTWCKLESVRYAGGRLVFRASKGYDLDSQIHDWTNLRLESVCAH